MSTYNMQRLLNPRSVALVGGSLRKGSVGAAVLRNIRGAGFVGDIGVVNPKHREIEGVTTYAGLPTLPFLPDLIVVTAPASAIPNVIEEAGRLGVPGAVVISSGLGHGNESFANRAEKAAREHRMRLIGPNCLGIISPRSNLNASFTAHTPKPGRLALISQSGAIVAGMVEWAAQKSVGFSGIISIGDQLDVDIADALDFFALDRETEAILLYVEAIKNARKFMSAARAAARLKPVIVVKSGRMSQGAKAAATHTGALAGSDAVYDAAFRRAGMLRLLDLRELFACAEILSRYPASLDKRLALLTNGGGLAVLAVDRLAELGGAPAELSADVRRSLDRVLPASWSKSNPVDIGGDADPARYREALEVLLRDSGSGAVLVMNVPTAIASSAEIAKEVARVVSANREANRPVKPVLAVWVGADDATLKSLDEAAIPNFPTEDDAVRSFSYLRNYAVAKRALSDVPPSVPDQFVPAIDTARAVVRAAISDNRQWLDPLEVKQLLDAYHIPMVTTIAARTPDEAARSSRPFLQKGHPVAVKVHSRDIVHKSDVGGVALNLIDADGVRDAARKMLERAQTARPEARIEGFIIQPMIVRPKARELIMGFSEDSTFGPVIVFGRGGTAVEILDDKALALPPLDTNLARDLVGRTKVSRLLGAYRDVPAVKMDEILLTLVKLAQLAADLPEIKAIDINPLLADETGVIAVDARIAIGPPTARFGGPGNARFAIRPYPSQWERRVEPKQHETLLIRPLRPEDEPALLDMLKHVTKNDLRTRFFSTIREFTHEFVARLTQLDYARSMAFAACDESHNILGVARFHSDSVYESAEYAILVRSDLKGKGIGWALMQTLIEYARSEGLRSLHGQVLRENSTMLEMCRELGFEQTADPSDPILASVTLKLG